VLEHREIGNLPPSIQLSRNGRPIEARRAEIGSVTVEDGRLRIADAAWVDQVPALPVRVPRGTHPVHAYQWHHRGETINACVAISFRRQLLPVTRQLVIETDIRPDLTEGVIVDTAEVAVSASNVLRLSSGLGDGYYPVIANANLGLWLQSLVVDFKIWHLPRVILMPGQEMDEYGFVRSSRDGPAAG
jgi:hypothetical protein